MRWMVLALLLGVPGIGFAAATAASPNQALRSLPPASPAAIQLAQSCVCHNPVGAAGETLCRRQRIVRCRANTRNQCGWEETTDRC